MVLAATVVLGFLSVTSSRTAMAQAEDVLQQWQEQKLQFEEQIKTRVEAEANRQVTKQALAEKMNLGWPVDPPSKTSAQIKEELTHRINGDVDARYPKSDIDRYKKDAAEKYKLFQPGDEVEFVIRGGVGPNTNVKGKLREVQAGAILINNPSRRIARTDIEEETLARFYADLSEKYIERDLRVKMIHRNNNIEGTTKELQLKYYPQAYREAGYVPRRKEFAKSIKPEYWVAKSDVLDHFYEKEKAAKIDEITGQIRQDVFTEAGWIFNEKLGEWTPKVESQSLVSKLKKLLGKGDGKDEEEAEDAKKKDDDTEWGENEDDDKEADEGNTKKDNEKGDKEKKAGKVKDDKGEESAKEDGAKPETKPDEVQPAEAKPAESKPEANKTEKPTPPEGGPAVAKPEGDGGGEAQWGEEKKDAAGEKKEVKKEEPKSQNDLFDEKQ
ncbi:MAG: hypothetical protein A3K18_29125 [Lentisphaerae bacterium RIFOXYA12_64_32]|nr:MAG: hypothetical protein A3K18_29125 [Lentisphaerae bacterium RIFOXYA12_64_32]